MSLCHYHKCTFMWHQNETNYKSKNSFTKHNSFSFSAYLHTLFVQKNWIMCLFIVPMCHSTLLCLRVTQMCHKTSVCQCLCQKTHCCVGDSSGFAVQSLNTHQSFHVQRPGLTKVDSWLTQQQNPGLLYTYEAQN